MRSWYIIACFILLHGAHATNNNITETKQHLKQLANKIIQLKRTLNTVHDKQALLNQEILATEKQINQNMQNLAEIQKKISLKNSDINALETEIDKINQKLTKEQQQLAKYIQARYKSGTNQPLNWIFTEENSQKIHRLLTFYQYIIRSNKNIILNVKKTKQALLVEEANLNLAIKDLQKLEQLAKQKQIQLIQHKSYHKTLLSSLNQEIKTKQHDLSTYQHDQANLSKLLTQLTRQSVLQTRHPFTQMRKKLPHPVITSQENIKKINQGIMFFSPEGTTVSAIFPGKVVFSDWLNGYGNLLIIDHGWGFMTLYANNRALFFKKGATVNQGEKIAAVGHSGILRQNGLYFEIRHQGKVIPPLDWLGK